MHEKESLNRWKSLIGSLNLKKIAPPFYFLEKVEAKGYIRMTDTGVKILKSPVG